MDWVLAHREVNVLPAYYRNVLWHDRTEFVLQDEVTVEELVDRARQVFTYLGLVPVDVSLWVYKGRENSRRWFSDIRFAFSPIVYPYRVTPQIIPNISSAIIESLNIVGTTVVEKIVGEEIMELINILPTLAVMFMFMMMMSSM